MTEQLAIEGALIRQLKWREDERGALIELYRDSWNTGRVAQVYLTETRPGVVKAWHHHKIQTDRFICVYGTVKLVLYDAREDSYTNDEIVEIVLSPSRNPCMVVIPPGVVHGWKCISKDTAGVVNCVSREYDGTDEYRRGPSTGPAEYYDYDWNKRCDG